MESKSNCNFAMRSGGVGSSVNRFAILPCVPRTDLVALSCADANSFGWLPVSSACE
ncbi:hypothetical protein SLEP1_g4676 [Rubroshorea leprosula]|uniref:Uncharacterized protein n=1 Tax=Rubroshorea leprosula TaxID=152421 RepID=A0AAV5HVV4_9ROSI|nr:hypothetical protein SLEP1_g4676 [Rubroshorea leprosula]